MTALVRPPRIQSSCRIIFNAGENSDERICRRGLHGPYHWLTVTGDVFIGTLLRLCPEVVLNRYLAVTSLDSGIRRLSEEETEAGWQLRGDVAYSPLVTSVDTLRYQRDGPEFPGYDEWYVFETPRELGRVFHGNFFEFQAGRGEILTFVNTFAFVLHDPEPYMPGILSIFGISSKRSNRSRLLQTEETVSRWSARIGICSIDSNSASLDKSLTPILS
jgi:hypothetical protein